MTSLQKKPFLLSFGRRVGKAMGDGKKGALTKTLPLLAVNIDKTSKNDSIAPNQWFDSPIQDVWMEIGFGGGEFLAKQLAHHPKVGFIGCEPFINGVASFLYSIEKNPPSNVKVWADDARMLLQKLIPCSLGKVYILFPDPWPKRRHHKRRLVSRYMLDLLANKLRPGGELVLATDHDDYAHWMREHLEAHPSFEWKSEQLKDGQTPPEDWIPTRYETKMRGQGRAPEFLYFVRKST